jgi:SAM-dependent methyltransferase
MVPQMAEHDNADAAAAAARIDAVWGNPADWDAEGRNWTWLPEVQRTINQRVTGDAAMTPLAWFFDRIARSRHLPVERALVLGCGGGPLERELVATGWVREVVAIDLSPSVLVRANAAAAQQGLRSIRYIHADMNRLVLDEAPFDVVLGSAAVHHCANLEALFGAVERLLVGDGWLYLNEYVGPNRFQWTDRQVHYANHLLSLLPDDLVRTLSGELRRGFRRIGPEEVAAHDPSEAVRSADIANAVAERFDVIERRGYGGALLHLVLAQIAQNFADPSPLSRPAIYLDRLIAAEDRLRRSGYLADDFAVILAQRRG